MHFMFWAKGQLWKVKCAGEVLARPFLGRKTYLEDGYDEEIYAIKVPAADVEASKEVA